MARVDRRVPQRRDIEFEQMEQRRADRRRIRLFPDVLILLLAVVIVFMAFKLMLPGSANKAAKTEEGADTGSIQNLSGLVISEVMALNKGAHSSANGEYYDWIELYNGTNQLINLQSYGLSDNQEKLSKYVFNNYLLNPGEYVIVFCSGLTENIPQGELHAPFKLSSAGETLVLTDAHNNIVDMLTYPSLGIDLVYARTGMAELEVVDYYTPGYPNTKEGYSDYQKTRWATESCPIIINEIMSSNNITLKDEDREYSDWVELYNTSSEPYNLSALSLSDDPGKPKKWTFPDIELQPNSYLVVFLSGKNRINPQGELHTTFSLNSYKDTLLLANGRGQIIEQVELNALKSDTSFGRVEGSDQWQEYTHATPGQPNTDAGYNAYQEGLFETLNSDIIISEVMSGNSATHQDDNGNYSDWIELYNRSGHSVSLKDWALSDNTGDFGKWRFPDVTIESDEYLLVYADGIASQPEETSKKKLHTNFNISAAGENIILADPDGNLMDQCSVPSLEFDMSYGRSPGANSFRYITSPTPLSANTQGYLGYAPIPNFSLKGGLYDGAQSVSLSVPETPNLKLVYTTDCSDPSSNSTVYSAPITFDKTTIIRARTYLEGYLPSPIQTSTYILDAMHTLPVMSVVADPELLYSDEKGILAMGPNASEKYPYKGANFWQRWEVTAHLQMIDYGNIIALDQDFGLRIFGAYSRANDAKNFALFARSRYGTSGFNYALFPERTQDTFNSVVLRNGASEWNMSKIRDVTCASLVRDTTDVDTQCYQPSVLYLNGKYQGVYFIQEKINEDYFVRNRGISPESLNLLVGNGNRSSYVISGSNEKWLALLDYLKTHDLSIQENYDYVASQVDIQNYMDYVICEIYVANTDTGNIKYWMSEEYDGKWRWIFYDVDWALMGDNVNWDSLSKYLDPKGHGVRNMFDNTLLLGLMKNEDFKEAFIERFAYHMNVTFEPQRFLSRIDAIAAQIDSEMVADKALWGYGDYNNWLKHVEVLRSFARKRPEYMKNHLKNYFGLSDQRMEELFG